VDASVWAEQGKLWTSPVAVGRSEHDQIEANIPRWAADLVNSSYDLSSLTALDRPLRPLFVSPASDLDRAEVSFARFLPVVCVSASKLAAEADGLERARGFTYVQGAGDDHESWCPKGLNPPLFWAHSDAILAASRETIDGIIADIIAAAATDPAPALANISLDSATAPTTSIRGTRLSIVYASSPLLPEPDSNTIEIRITASRTPPPPSSELHTRTHLYPRTGKQGYKPFFAELDTALTLIEDKLRDFHQVVVVVEAVAAGESQSEANDLGSAVVVAVLGKST